MATIEGIEEFQEIKTEVDEVLNTYGSTLEVQSVSDWSDTDEWGEPIYNAGESEVYYGVYYNNSVLRQLFSGQNILKDGESLIIVGGDVDVDKDDIITFQGSTYKLIEKEVVGAADLVVAQNLKVGLVETNSATSS